MLRYVRITAAVVGTLALLGAVGWLAVGSPWLRYQRLDVVGNDRADVVQLRHLARLPEGEPLVLLDLESAVAGVQRHPWVQSASASRRFPNTVVIEVVERTPVALVQLAGLYLVDAEGTLFARAGEGDLDHPILSGLDPALASGQPELSRRLVRTGLDWLAAAQAQGGLAEADISELHFNVKTGYTLYLRNGGEVLLGFTGNERVARLSMLTARGLDLRSPHRVDLATDRVAVVTPL